MMKMVDLNPGGRSKPGIPLLNSSTNKHKRIPITYVNEFTILFPIIVDSQKTSKAVFIPDLGVGLELQKKISQVGQT